MKQKTRRRHFEEGDNVIVRDRVTHKVKRAVYVTAPKKKGWKHVVRYNNGKLDLVNDDNIAPRGGSFWSRPDSSKQHHEELNRVWMRRPYTGAVTRVASKRGVRGKLEGAFKEALRRKMNIDTGLALVSKSTGVPIGKLHEAYGALARKGVYPKSPNFVAEMMKKLRIAAKVKKMTFYTVYSNINEFTSDRGDVSANEDEHGRPVGVAIAAFRNNVGVKYKKYKTAEQAKKAVNTFCRNGKFPSGAKTTVPKELRGRTARVRVSMRLIDAEEARV